ncbi:MAG: TetR/AcrR family transcriptional regulator [Acidimicrobiia bacterium]|nr:TetR/AcrR family transcriptional regulator [Acidimicrobiia bacterium]
MPRQGLNRRKVLEAALLIVDTEGLGDLTMRRLGQQLGVEAPSLYKHVEGKADILDGIIDLVYEEIDFGDAKGEFRDRVRSYAKSFRDSLLRHPNVVQLLAMRPVTGKTTIELVEAALRELTTLGLDPQDGRRFLNVTVNFIIGHTLSQVGEQQAPFEEIMTARRQFDPDEYPNFSQSLASAPVDHDGEFELGIEMIVDGIERTVAALVQA